MPAPAHNWTELDPRIRDLAALGHNGNRIAELLSLPVKRVRDRAADIGVSLSQFGPESVCKKGHKLQEAGAQKDISGHVRCPICAEANRIALNARNRSGRTHCKRGHDLAKVGTYRGQKCIQCSKDSYYERRDMLRKERLRAKQAAGASLKQNNQPERAGFTEAALLLFRRAEDAMPWERDAMKARARAMAHGEPQPAGGER